MRNKCPDEEKIGDYVEGVLNESEKPLIEAHLSDCEICRNAVVIGNDLLRGAGQEFARVPENVTKSALELINDMGFPVITSLPIKIRRVLKNIYSKITASLNPFPWWRLGLTTIRGKHHVVAEDFIHVQKYFKGIRAEIDIEKVDKNKINISIDLFKDKENGNGIRVTLLKKGREVSSILTDSNGHVIFDGITYGHYSLILLKNGLKLGEYLFEIKEPENGR
ncbi:zf-HC2 domain-containing protein [Thermodesulfobacteriota bacterium]